MKLHRLRFIFWFVFCALAASWLLLAGTPYENTLWLAAKGKVDLGLSLFYRFRDSNIATDGSWAGPGLKVFLFIAAWLGVRGAWIAGIVLQAILLRRKSMAIQGASLLFLFAGILWGEALLSWNLLFTLLVTLFNRIAAPHRGFAVAATFFVFAGFISSIELVWVLGNPARSWTRQSVLGGKSLLDTLHPHVPRQGIELHENCLAVLNPDDIRGVQGVEMLSQASLARFSDIILLDLKIIEAKYLLLTLKDEKGELLFSNAARSFAEKEKAYATAVRTRLDSAPQLCLIAPFEQMPDREIPPYSRAREILDARQKAGLNTQIIQLPPW